MPVGGIGGRRCNCATYLRRGCFTEAGGGYCGYETVTSPVTTGTSQRQRICAMNCRVAELFGAAALKGF